ncbi:MAG: trigger factor [Lachnospiraceae bacterium]|nr:trigger factor [Lachnospiraceae bacterium]
MKKGYLAAVLALSVSLLLGGCGKKEEENTDGSSDRVSGSATVESYRGVEYEKYATEVTEEEVDAYVQSFLSSVATKTEVTDRDDVQAGDTVNIDYTGYMDGEAFEGGADTGYDLTIGSGAFIPGFEDGLIGAKKGTTVDVEVTFPDPYKNNPDFSGKPATFTVTINSINIMKEPELTDALVAENTDYDTIEAYREYIKSNLSTQRQNYAVSYKEAAVMKNLVESATFEGIEQTDIDEYYESQYNYYKELAAAYQSMYGYDFDTFIRYFFGCTTEEQYQEILKENAEYEVKKMLVLYEVIDAEKLTASEEEYQEAIKEYASNYGITVEEFEEQVDKAQVRDLILIEKAKQLVYDTAVEVETMEEK